MCSSVFGSAKWFKVNKGITRKQVLQCYFTVS